jgi:hypothetical protein
MDAQTRCIDCDHAEHDHTQSRRHPQMPPTACTRDTGYGNVCECEAFVAPALLEQELPASSWGLHCHEEGCSEMLVLTRTSAEPSMHEFDYRVLSAALDTAAMFMGWRLWHGVWWCSQHIVPSAELPYE